ncbi:MAG: adenine deaminase, partial [Hyphomicrobiaceae bacterium]
MSKNSVGLLPLSACTPRLVDVAMGRSPADCVVRNARWVNVHSGEILEGTDIAIASGRFAAVGPDLEVVVGEETVVVEAGDRYVVPGLCDGQMRVESGMVTVTEFVRAVVSHGTTSMFIDPHEIANVLGLRGVRLMHDEAVAAPINVFVQAPSCVPSAPGLENAGATLGPDDIAEAMTWPGIIGLGEVMNFPGVAAGDPTLLGEIAATQSCGKTVGGHYASQDLGRAFHGYVAGGPEDDHEGTRVEDAIARVRQGMRAMLRLGSAWYDVANQIRAVTEFGLDSRNFILCTDDCHSGTLVEDGHMDRVVRHAIAQGVRPITAIQMATLNTAQHFSLERELGSITPGRRADFLLLSDLAAFQVEDVFARGRHMAQAGKLIADVPAYRYPVDTTKTVNIGRTLADKDFDVEAPAGADLVRVNVIGVVENQAPTQALERVVPVINGVLVGNADDDICHVALVERHRGSGTVVNGFVSGFGYRKQCALASTVAHDSHHMIVVGTSKADMASAANRLAEIGGGVSLFADGDEMATISLPIAGLMSERRVEEVAAEAALLGDAMR